MKNLPASNASTEEISQRAHMIWIQNGRPEGRDLEHWLQAEAELQRQRAKTAPSESSASRKQTGRR